MIKENDVVVIQSGDNFNPYFLLVANQEMMELEECMKDAYGHVFKPGDFVIIGNFLEKISDGRYYKDDDKQAIISSYCVAGISPALTLSVGNRQHL